MLSQNTYMCDSIVIIMAGKLLIVIIYSNDAVAKMHSNQIKSNQIKF